MSLTDSERAMADEGIERLEAAILRGVSRGISVEEATDRHVDALFETYPGAASVIFERMAELTLKEDRP